MRLLLVCLALLLTTACHAPVSRGASGPGRAGDSLRLATWNFEWLVAPENFVALKRTCVPQGASPGGRRRTLPCDAAARLERSTADFEAIARYARQLDADVVALQEVDGPSAARRVFPKGYRFCFTGAEAVQNVGFAVRDGIPFRCGPDLVELSLDGRVRRGAELRLYPGTSAEIHLLAVHWQALADNGLEVDPDLYSAAAAAEFRVQSIDRVGMQLVFGAAFDLPYLARINRTVDHLVAITG